MSTYPFGLILFHDIGPTTVRNRRYRESWHNDGLWYMYTVPRTRAFSKEWLARQELHDSLENIVYELTSGDDGEVANGQTNTTSQISNGIVIYIYIYILCI